MDRFDNQISRTNLDTGAAVYRTMVDTLEGEFSFKTTTFAEMNASQHVLKIHEITKDFYRTMYADLFTGFVPLYLSLWKQRLRDVLHVDNIHQDGGVHYFSKDGYQSRMISVWTSIFKEPIVGLSESDLGLFVVDNRDPRNRALYEEMEKENAHFFRKRDGQLMDCMHVAGKVIKCDTSALARTYFDYHEGTSICFNSHLLHGTKAFEGDASEYSEADLDRFRVALTAVWIHRDDLDWSVVSVSEQEHDSLYLRKHERSRWPGLKEVFSEACQAENHRLVLIKRLINAHCASSSEVNRPGRA